jgi:metacaspase-1
MATGISVHIGLNAVNPRHYMGWSGPLAACEYDARDMARLAESLDYARTTVLLTKQATTRRVVSAMRAAAKALAPGDAFFLTYSGHGGQVTDTNGDEATRDYGEMGEVGDTKDETWCLYDRQLIDDELYALWAEFPARCRIFVLSDSCHSGSVTRDVPDFDLILAGAASAGVPRVATDPPADRGMPVDIAEEVSRGRSAVYARVQAEVPPRQSTKVGATVGLISGCQDNQTSLDGARNGLFTEKMLQVWDGSAFTGSLHDLRNGVSRLMPASQTPNYYVVGRRNVRALRRPALRV